MIALAVLPYYQYDNCSIFLANFKDKNQDFNELYSCKLMGIHAYVLLVFHRKHIGVNMAYKYRLSIKITQLYNHTVNQTPLQLPHIAETQKMKIHSPLTRSFNFSSAFARSSSLTSSRM